MMLASVGGFAQRAARYNIDGCVRDSLSGNTLGYATITLSDSVGTIRSAVAAGPDGRFSIASKVAGHNTLGVTLVDYTPKSIALNLTEGRLKIGDILLSASPTDIDAVNVVATVPLVEVDDEKLTYNLEQDPETATSQLIDIIRKIPQLSIDGEGNVLLNGQSNYKMLVNNRNSSSMSRNFKDIIESMPASAIKRIEVITNPSTKYEAEGAGGIINIITNRGASIKGYNGNVGLNGSTDASAGGDLYFATQAGKVSTSVSLYGSYSSTLHRSSNDYKQAIFGDDSTRYTLGHTSSRSRGAFVGANVSVSYDIDTLNLLTFELGGSYYRNRGFTDGRSLKYTADNDLSIFDTTQIYTTSYNTSYNSGGTQGSVNYQHTFGKEDHTLTLSYDFDYAPGTSSVDNRYNAVYNFDGYRTSTDQTDRSFSNTAQIDYYNPLSDIHKIECGIKYTYRISNTEADKQRRYDSTVLWTPDPYTPNSDMRYVQNILGVYAGYSVRLKKFSGKIGGRFEEAWSDVRTVVPDGSTVRFRPSFPNVIPYMSINYRPTDVHSLSLSYTQRLHRPSIFLMNPFRNESEDFVSYGNPDLKVVLHHNFGLGYRLMTSAWTFSLRGDASFSGNAISAYSFVGDDGRINNTCGNVVNRQRYGVNTSLTYRYKTRFYVSLSFNGSYTILNARKITLSDGTKIKLHNEGFEYGISGNINVELWKDASLYCNVYGFQNGISLTDSPASKLTVYYGFGLRQQLLNRKLSLSLRISNPFNPWVDYDYTSQTVEYRMNSRYRNRNSAISFSVGYRFGRNNVDMKQANRTISSDDISDGKTSR